MIINSRFEMTSKQLIFVLIGAMVGVGIFSLPREVTADGGPDGWIGILIGALVPVASLMMVERLRRRFPNLSFPDMSQLLFGKLLGSLLIGLFVLYIIFLQGMVVRIFSQITSMYVLPNTPISVIAFLIVFACVFIVYRGAKLVARVNELLFYILVMNVVFVLASLAVGDYTNILPIGQWGVTNILKAASATVFAYGGIEILIVLYPMVTRKDEVLKAGFTAIALTVVLYLTFTIICIVVFGHTQLQRIIWPTLTLLKVSVIAVFERLELFFLAFWIGIGIRPVINSLLVASFSLTQLLHLNLTRHYPFVVMGIGAAIYAMALIPKNINQAFRYGTYGSYVFLVMALVYPALFLLLAIIRKKKNVGESI